MIYICRLLVLLAFGGFVVACGGHHKADAPVIENVYVQHMKDFTHVGVEAMHQERWASAEHAFKRALQMAQLANDPIRMVAAWYNLSMAYKAEKQLDKAEFALQKLLHLAKTHGFSAYVLRAKLQLALLHLKQGDDSGQVPVLAEHLPADIYLMAAKLAYMQQHMELAEVAYKRVIAASGKSRAGLLLQAKALMGLSLLASKQLDPGAAKIYGLEVLTLCKKLGAPRLSADVSLLLASLESQGSKSERRDYAERAKDIYRILHDEKGVNKSSALLQTLAE